MNTATSQSLSDQGSHSDKDRVHEDLLYVRLNPFQIRVVIQTILRSMMNEGVGLNPFQIRVVIQT